MAFKLTEWPLLVRDNPAEAKRQVLAALTNAEGVVARAARDLGISLSAMWRRVRDVGVQEDVEWIRQAAERERARIRAEEYESAHSQGLHDEVPRDGCPECPRRGIVR